MKKLISLLLVFALVICAALPAAASFSDTGNSELAGKLELLSALGVVNGYPDGSFKPNNNLTRAEFTKLVVTLLDHESDSLVYSNYTYFPDVRSVHWASKYVNYAARVLGLVKGDGTGNFNPDKPITYREAVTIVMRALGYTDELVGGRWPDGYFAKAAALGLTGGIKLSATQIVTRGIGAELFYNALYTERYSGGTLISERSGGMMENILLLSVDTDKKTVLSSDGTVFKTRSAFPKEYAGKRGTLILDNAGVAIGFMPGEQTILELVISRTDSASLTSTDGTYIRIANNTPVYTSGNSTQSNWSGMWYSIPAGTAVSVAIDVSGTVDYITVSFASEYSEAVVLESVPTQASLCAMLSAPADARILKNGVESKASDLRRWDVVSYSPAANVINVSDFKLSVVYEGAYPSLQTPDKVTAYAGNTFDALRTAADSLRGFAIGDKMTLLFAADGKVAGAIPTDTVVYQTGYYDGSTVSFVGGVSVKADLELDAGTLVRVGQVYAKKLSVSSAAMGMQSYGKFDVEKMTLGSRNVLPNVEIYERLGTRGQLRRIQLGDIPTAYVNSGSILYANYDWLGRVNLLVIQDVTGVGYVYGKMTSRSEIETYSGTGGSDSVWKEYVTVANSEGTFTYNSSSYYERNGEWGAAAIAADGCIEYIAPVVSVSGISAFDFVGSDSVRVNGAVTRIAENVQVYIKTSDSFLMASDYSSAAEMTGFAKNMGTKFTVILDRMPSNGGIVRGIVVE